MVLQEKYLYRKSATIILCSHGVFQVVMLPIALAPDQQGDSDMQHAQFQILGESTLEQLQAHVLQVQHLFI
jgi:hypothetical protein